LLFAAVLIAAAALLPGYFWMLQTERVDAADTQQQQQQWQQQKLGNLGNSIASDGADPRYVPTPCPQKFYCPGGMQLGSITSSNSGTPGAVTCPQGLWTKQMRATSVDGCSK
jgi:hypothetical protein